MFPQRIREAAGPNRATNGRADRIPNGRKQIENGQDRRQVLVRDGRHEGHLGRDDQRTASKSHKDLRHDHVPDLGVGAAEVDHESDAEKHERHAEVQSYPLEAAGDAHEVPQDQSREARADAVDVADVGSFGDGLVPDDHEHGREVRAPDGGIKEQEEEHKSGKQNGAVRQRLEGDEVDGGEKPFVRDEDDQQHGADDGHGDDLGVLPAELLLEADGQGDQNQRHASCQENDTQKVHLDEEAVGRARRDFGTPVGHQPLLLGAGQLHPEEDDERQDDDGRDDGEDAEAPAPAGATHQRVAHRAADPGRDDVGRGGEGEHQATGLEGGGVGDEDC